MSRSWLAALLRDEAPPWPSPDVRDPAQLLETAANEGIVALAHAKLHAQGYPESLRGPFAEAARGQAAVQMVREGECRRVLAVIASLGLDALLLKGSALAYWAYPEPHLRECADIDLMLKSRGDVDRLIAALADSGYRTRERDVPGDLVSYELTCIRRAAHGARVDLDLHWRLVNAPLYAHRLEVGELWRHAIALPRLGPTALGLSPVHALLHACMHRVLNLQFGIGNRLKWLYDLHLLSLGFDDAQWDQLLALAGDRGLASTCWQSLRVASAEFGTRIPEAIAAQLIAISAGESFDAGKADRWLYMQVANGRALPGHRARLRWLRQRLLPNAVFLRDRYGDGQLSLAAIVFARLRSGLRRMGF